MTAYDDLSDDARNLMAGFSELDIAEIAADAQRAATTLSQRLATAETERDGAYRERAQLLAWLAALHPAVRAPAPDIDEDGWQILYLNPTGGGQMSWHIAPRDAELLEHVEQVPADDKRAQWDGHTTEAKYERIQALTTALAELEPDDADEEVDDSSDSDSDVFAFISEVASRLTDATDEGEYQAAGLIGDLANGRKTVAEAREELADITFRHV